MTLTEKKKIVYIAGPMTGLRNFNLNSFTVAEKALQSQGYEVRNPACLGHGWSDYEHYMEVDMVMLGQCDHIVFLPGSEKSPGAQREAARAKELRITDLAGPLKNVWGVLEQTYINNGGEA